MVFNPNVLWKWYDNKPDYLRFYLMFVILGPAFILMMIKSTERFGHLLFGITGLWRVMYITKIDLQRVRK